MANNHHRPTFAEEKALYKEGYRLVAGVDEVGRGALVGPVVAAAVVLPRRINAHWQYQVRDSKQLRPAKREYLSAFIQEVAISVGIGIVPHDIVDSQGIVRATRLAMKSAIDQLVPQPQYLLIDYLRLPEVPLRQKGITDGDNLCFSIACASIVAKVARDRLMIELDAVYPGYRLAKHKGYGTKEHLACLRRQGPCPIHRRSFQPVRDLMQEI